MNDSVKTIGFINSSSFRIYRVLPYFYHRIIFNNFTFTLHIKFGLSFRFFSEIRAYFSPIWQSGAFLHIINCDLHQMPFKMWKNQADDITYIVSRRRSSFFLRRLVFYPKFNAFKLTIITEYNFFEYILRTKFFLPQNGDNDELYP